MANNANDVLKIARGEVGYSRWTDPQQGIKYGRWYVGPDTAANVQNAINAGYFKM